MGKQNSRGFRPLSAEQREKTIGPSLSFAASEAYKLLRTNLSFSFPDQTGCRVIGITSSASGEGKSTTSINLAYTIAQENRRVLLLEADLRLPTMAKYLGVKTAPGLSNLLAGQCGGTDILQRSGLNKNFWVATAGDIPPNPAELLSSQQMAATIETLKGFFDVIILDLPPVTVVSDAIAVSKLTDGMVLVVRQNYCSKAQVSEAVRKLRFTGSRLLGFVMTGSDMARKGYSRSYYRANDERRHD